MPKNGTEIKLVTTEGVFSPNTTTELLINAVKKTILKPVKTLDLGCGTGVVGLSLWLEGLSKKPIYASDLSEPSVFCSQENFKRYECEADVRCGALFEPWIDEKFDLIFMDPPYNKNLINETLEQISDNKLLSPIGKIVVEHSDREKISDKFAEKITKQKKAGNTLITILEL